MKICIFDYRDDRREKITKFFDIEQSHAHVDGGNTKPTNWELAKGKCHKLVKNCDLVFLHMGEEQKYSMEVLKECFCEKYVFCYTGGYLSDEVKKEINEKDKWCFLEVFGEFSKTEFKGSTEEKLLQKYVTQIKNGASALEAKIDFQGIDLKLENILVELHDMVQCNKSPDEIIKRRDAYDWADQ